MAHYMRYWRLRDPFSETRSALFLDSDIAFVERSITSAAAADPTPRFLGKNEWVRDRG
jgi:lipopolysaccharide biosynthesis glycosyltransferase